VLAITFPQGSYLLPLYTHVSVLHLIVSVHASKLCRFTKFCHQSEVNHITDQSPTCVCKLETIQPQFHLTDFRLLVSTEQQNSRTAVQTYIHCDVFAAQCAKVQPFGYEHCTSKTILEINIILILDLYITFYRCVIMIKVLHFQK